MADVDYNAVQAWQDRYNNVLADIANSSSDAERQQKVNYYEKSGELQQFRDSGLNPDNDIAYIGGANNNQQAASFPEPSLQQNQSSTQTDNTDAVTAWNDRYQNVLADIANSSTSTERQQKVNYYEKSGELQQFRDSGLNPDNDIAWIGNNSPADKQQETYTGVPTIDNVISAGKRYVDTAKEDIANLQAANIAANKARENTGQAPLTVENAWNDPNAKNTPQQTETSSQAYRDIVGTPAGNLAITPFVPAPIRAAAGVAYLPNLVHDVAQSYEKNSKATGSASPLDMWSGKSKQPSPLEAFANTAKETLVNPIVDQVKEVITQPGQFVGEIANDPTKLWQKVFMPAAILEHPLKSAANKIADTAIDRQFNKLEVPSAPEAITATETSASPLDNWKAPANVPEEKQATSTPPNTSPEATGEAKKSIPNVSTAVPETELQTAKEAIEANEQKTNQPEQSANIAQAEATKSDEHPAEPTKQLWQMTNEDYDTHRLNQLAPNWSTEFTPNEKSGVAAGANVETKTVHRERGIDSDDVFSHELRHVIIDNHLPNWDKVYTPAREQSVQNYLKENRPHDYTDPETQGKNDIPTWEENAQALLDDYYKNPERLKQGLPAIYSYFNKNGLDKFKNFDVSHRAIVQQALSEGKPVPPEVLAEYPDLQKQPNDTTGLANVFNGLGNAVNDSFIDSMWKNVQNGKKINRMGNKSVEQLLRNLQDAGKLTSRDDVKKVVNDYYEPKGVMPNETTVNANQEAPNPQNATSPIIPLENSQNARNAKIGTGQTGNGNIIANGIRSEPNEPIVNAKLITNTASTINSGDTANAEHEQPTTRQLNESVIPSEHPDLVAPERPMSQQVAQQLFANQQQKFQMLNDIYDSTKKAFRDIRQAFSAASVSDEAGLAGRSMRENMSEMARKYDIAEDAMHKTRMYFDKVPETEAIKFTSDYEHGRIQDIPKELRPTAMILKALFDQRVEEVRKLGTGKLQTLIDNYFPHIWKDPNAAEMDFAGWTGKRPLEGSKAFTKQRTIPTTDDGLSWRVYDKDNNMIQSFPNQADAESLAAQTPDSRIGRPLQPVTNNPIDLALLKIREMDKYIMAHKVENELKSNGLGEFSNARPSAHPDWVPVGTQVGDGGRFWAHPDAAKLLNNYLSPGLRGNGLYDMARSAGNQLNQFQLGISAFHLGFTSYDTMVSKLALAMKQSSTATNELRKGNIKTAGQFAGGALKSTIEAATPLAAPVLTAMKGSKYLKEWYKPGSQGGEVTQIMDALSSGGARARMDSFYAKTGEQRFSQEMKDTLANMNNGNYGTAGAWAAKQILPWNFIRTIPRIIMEEVVPRQKLGVAASMMEYELKKNPNMTHDQIRESARKVWDSVDNRLGQLVYDNLFWNKMLKDGLMLGTRSVGWNLGTWRELGGGLVDLGAMPIDLVRGKPMEFSHRTSYLAALTLSTVVTGSIITRLATGQNPKDWRDYFFPRIGGTDENGNAERVSLPSYAKDVYAVAHRAGQHGLGHALVENGSSKLNPFFQTLAEMYSNKDYFGKEIYHPADTLVQKAGEVGKYLAGQVVPFSSQGLQKIKDSENKTLDNPKPTTVLGYLNPNYLGREFINKFVPTSLKQALPMVGVTPAPHDINKTDAEQLATEINQRRFGEAQGKTTAQANTSDLETKIRRDLQSGNTTSLVQALHSGAISKAQATHLNELKGMTPLQQQIHNMDIDDALEIYKAGTPQEQAQLKQLVIKKIANKIKKGATPDDRVKYNTIRKSLFGQ